MMNPQLTVSIPEIFVLWHPRCPLGEKLARRLLDWLRPGSGLGPEVFYRSLPAPDAPPNGLPLPLPGEERLKCDLFTRTRNNVSNLQVVVPLIDENMVADQAWRHWIEQLSVQNPSSIQRSSKIHPIILPVALDATAYNMPPALRKLNYLRPAGLPFPAGNSPAGAAFEDVVRSFLKQVTESLCRHVLPRPVDPAPDPRDPRSKIKIFLSHAKQDGIIPARRLRDYIYSQTQLAAFYDENDVGFGSAFSREILRGLSAPETAALIAVNSARYASRPWCRREFSFFRQPREDGRSAGGAERRFLYPSLVVEAMEGSQSSFGVPEFGCAPTIRWTDDDPNLEEMIVMTVIRDAMLASFHSALGAAIPSKPNQIIINWLPDPTTLQHIPAIRTGAKLDLLYPGSGLSSLEIDILGEMYPSLTFKSFEQVLL